ncbi:uncharacterized protein LOC143465662 [Clavelina lepadiformis]|uniref:Uncharacterized protein n=1 Tax=Clavelina lepadiformis TaxID=159417 RepID=A0ABP0EW11_CLALP
MEERRTLQQDEKMKLLSIVTILLLLFTVFCGVLMTLLVHLIVMASNLQDGPNHYVTHKEVWIDLYQRWENHYVNLYTTIRYWNYYKDGKLHVDVPGHLVN